MHNYKKLNVWMKAVDLATSIYTMTISYPIEERFGLVAQMRRCAVSIPSNIAEGSSRSSKKDFSRFLEIALGSAFELETQTIVSHNLGFIDIENQDNHLSMITEVQKMLSALITSNK